MALKSTIYKVDLQIADLDRHVYVDHALTLARHPSETEERVMVRLIAFAAFAHERLAFASGLSDVDEPALWQRDLTGAIERWIEIGLPDARRVIRAGGRAAQVAVLAYGRGVDVWWAGIERDLARMRHLEVLRVVETSGDALGTLARRTMRVAVTLQEGHAIVAADAGTSECELVRLRASALDRN